MSAVREAIKAVVERWAETSAEPVVQRHGGLDPLGADRAGFLMDLVEAVERVPVTVTIRDLDMSPENVIVVEGAALMELAYEAEHQRFNGQRLALCVDQGWLKTKRLDTVHVEVWSPPIKTTEYTG